MFRKLRDYKVGGLMESIVTSILCLFIISILFVVIPMIPWKAVAVLGGGVALGGLLYVFDFPKIWYRLLKKLEG